MNWLINDKTNPWRGEPLTLRQFIVNTLRMTPGTVEEKERSAAASLGALKFASRRRSRRLRILATARGVAEEVGHVSWDVARPQPDIMIVPANAAELVAELLGNYPRK